MLERIEIVPAPPVVDVVTGAATDEATGYAVAYGGDTDGDGWSDLLIGSVSSGSGDGLVSLLVGVESGSWPADVSDSTGQMQGTDTERLGAALDAFNRQGIQS